MLLCEMEFETLLIGQVSSGKIPDVYFYPNMRFLQYFAWYLALFPLLYLCILISLCSLVGKEFYPGLQNWSWDIPFFYEQNLI